MTVRPAEPRGPQPGDTITITGTVRKVRGRGHMALVETAGGSFYVPLVVDGQLPDESIVVTPAPEPATVREIGGR